MTLTPAPDQVVELFALIALICIGQVGSLSKAGSELGTEYLVLIGLLTLGPLLARPDPPRGV